MEDELEISEESNVYKLTLKEDAKNILDLIEYEYTIDLDSLNEDDVDREIEIHIDRNTKLLDKFSLEIKPKAEELKGTNLSALTNFSSHK